MTIKVTLEFQTEDEMLRYFMRDKVQPGPVAIPPAPSKRSAKAPRAEAPVEDAAPVVKVVAPEAKPVPVKAALKVPNAPVQAVAEVNEAAVRAALREVVNTKSMKAAADVLREFGAVSISQVTQAQYADFIKACGK
jgi:hypothetical protein